MSGQKNKLTIGRDVAEQMLKEICDQLEIEFEEIDRAEDGGTSAAAKIIGAISRGRLTYENGVFTQQLLRSVGDVKILRIEEPKGVQLRGSAEIKAKNDMIGKAMAVLGEVTGHGLPVINKLAARDLMVAVSVVSLFL